MIIHSRKNKTKVDIFWQISANVAVFLFLVL